MKITHIFMAVFLLTALTIVGSIASDQEWIITTKEEASHSKYLDLNTTEVKVTLEEAKAIMISENPELDSDSINGELINDSDFGIIWQLTSKTSNDRSIRACIDPDDGNILYIYDGSKKTRADSKVSEEEAVEIAGKYVEAKFSPEQLKEVQLEAVNYLEPVADDLPGFYHIKYNRIINGISSLSDGVIMRVNSETGDVSTYNERWDMPGYETYVVDNKSILTEKEAAGCLKEFIGNEVYDGKTSDTTEVIESKLFWKYTENDEIHLVWWMQFTDSNLGLDKSLPGIVFIDANTGTVLVSSYEIG
ncbi:YcdB/YcdC domain-containing protein [Methanococcoides burtonii]|uniref:PepSY domain protein n=1 Tax=Methanococcoides burtonii (strain DSM 6242 / NBRC 107633 / OCM 468 / ACE-M) TaxID=259564 RepID=Q12VC4_METBU|nr:YcdB/YcdC domain-containing protein [Methanococcoides burtonii]ABE52602.1 PepSY domain protein [Methanococcoides burtonii DSM 6242]